MAPQLPSAVHQLAAGSSATHRIAVKVSANALKQGGRSVSSLAQSLINEIAHSAATCIANVRIEPLITSQPPKAVAKLVKQAAHLDPTYMPTHSGSWFQLYLDVVTAADATNTGGDRATSSGRPGTVADSNVVNQFVRRLLEQPDVEAAHPLGNKDKLTMTPSPSTVTMAVALADDSRSVSQGYLNPAPQGIDACYAWKFCGGDGAGIGFVEMDKG